MSGMLGDLIKQMSAMGLMAKPQLMQNELVITFTEQEFLEATSRGLDARAKNNISIKFQDGKMIIKIKLF
mgnify:CR=1 FL=1